MTIQPLEWAIICALAAAVAGLVVYLWNDARKRDAEDREALEERLQVAQDTLHASIRGTEERLRWHGKLRHVPDWIRYWRRELPQREDRRDHCSQRSDVYHAVTT